MYITVNQLANKINNLERFTFDELKNENDNSIIKIIVKLLEDGHRIKYFVDTKSGNREQYTEQNIPLSIVRIMNYSKPIYKTDDTIIYRFY